MNKRKLGKLYASGITPQAAKHNITRPTNTGVARARSVENYEFYKIMVNVFERLFRTSPRGPRLLM